MVESKQVQTYPELSLHAKQISIIQIAWLADVKRNAHDISGRDDWYSYSNGKVYAAVCNGYRRDHASTVHASWLLFHNHWQIINITRQYPRKSQFSPTNKALFNMLAFRIAWTGEIRYHRCYRMFLLFVSMPPPPATRPAIVRSQPSPAAVGQLNVGSDCRPDNGPDSRHDESTRILRAVEQIKTDNRIL